MSDTSAVVVVAMRQADLPEAHVPSVAGRCADCDEPVWISAVSDDELQHRPGSEVICQVCGMGRITRSTEVVTFEVFPGTAKEIADHYLGRRP